MQNPNEDTEWNDVLRAKGIIPQKEKEITENDIVDMLEKTIEQKQKNHEKELSEKTLDELDELEDSEDEAILLEYRNKRIAELKALASRRKFGNVLEISGQDYIQEVTKAGEDIWVVLHLYSKGVPFCALLNQHLNVLAAKFPHTKFIRSIATTCIANYPERNVPTIFIYHNGKMIKQFIGALDLNGPNLTVDEFEYMIGQTDAIETKIKEDPRKAKAVQDKMFKDLADTNDW
uniref:Putative conserved phosducin-like protein n=1 Tax=Corethrella appendiculata TaxID=1370023 RepID=U5ETY0_9DIPT